MKRKFVNMMLRIVKKEKNYSEDEIEVMKYAIECIYLTGTKIVVITILAYIFGIFHEYLLFILFYAPLRLLSFGWHANTSKECWIISISAFIFIPYLCSILNIPLYVKIIALIMCLVACTLYAPADTKKRPIVSSKRRLFFKASTLIILFIYSFYIIRNSNLISNIMLTSLLYQSLLINPLIYKLSHQSFNNYKAYNLSE